MFFPTSAHMNEVVYFRFIDKLKLRASAFYRLKKNDGMITMILWMLKDCEGFDGIDVGRFIDVTWYWSTMEIDHKNQWMIMNERRWRLILVSQLIAWTSYLGVWMIEVIARS